jgi:hypothetical protein
MLSLSFSDITRRHHRKNVISVAISLFFSAKFVIACTKFSRFTGDYFFVDLQMLAQTLLLFTGAKP